MGADSIASTTIIVDGPKTNLELFHHIILEECETGKVIGRKDIGENFLQEGREYLQNIIENMEGYKLVILHFTQEDYHTRILAKKSFATNGIKCEEVIYRANIYKIIKPIDKSIEQKKNRGCNWFRFLNRTEKPVVKSTENTYVFPVDTRDVIISDKIEYGSFAAETASQVYVPIPECLLSCNWEPSH